MQTPRKSERGWVRHQNSSPNFTVAIVRPRPRRVNRMGGCAKLGSGSDIQQISTLAMLAFGAVRIRVQLTVAVYSGDGRTSPVIPSWLPTGAVSSAQGRHPSKPFLLAGEKSMSRVPPKHLLFAALFLLPAIRN